jgi:hypothetical protein
MSPESVDKKTRAVQSYFKFPGEEKGTTASTAEVLRPRYARAGKKSEVYKGQIRKSASQGKIMNRQRSFSDPDEDEEDVDSIFESLFKASGKKKNGLSFSQHGVRLTSEA